MGGNVERERGRMKSLERSGEEGKGGCVCVGGGGE